MAFFRQTCTPWCEEYYTVSTTLFLWYTFINFPSWINFLPGANILGIQLPVRLFWIESIFLNISCWRMYSLMWEATSPIWTAASRVSLHQYLLYFQLKQSDLTTESFIVWMCSLCIFKDLLQEQFVPGCRSNEQFQVLTQWSKHTGVMSNFESINSVK